MSSFWILLTLLAVLVNFRTLALDEDFAFDITDDVELELSPESPKKLWGVPDMTAYVGQLFHLIIPKEAFGEDVNTYEVKRQDDNPLPTWLLFDKTGGVFWGVPTKDDVKVLDLTIRAIRSKSVVAHNFRIKIEETNNFPGNVIQCLSNEDKTILILLIDKGVAATKPKQRVIAINNIAKFFNLPYSAFSLVPFQQHDDIKESSVILAGPGSLSTRSSKLTSVLQVVVGCDGRLSTNMAPLVHQLKQQARDGTIAEVLRLPLIGWRVKTVPTSRKKRQVEDYGSGDYDENYYEEDYDSEIDYTESPVTSQTMHTSPKTPPLITTPFPKVTQPETNPISEMHPHRHHHGELRPVDEDSDLHIIDEIPDQSTIETETTTKQIPETTPVRVPLPPINTVTVTPLPTTTMTIKTAVTEQVIVTETASTEINKNNLHQPASVDIYDFYEDNGADYDDEDKESETEVPEIGTNHKNIEVEESGHVFIPQIVSTTEKITTARLQTQFDVIEETSPPTTEVPTTFRLTTFEETPISFNTTVTVATTTTTEKPTTEEAPITSRHITTTKQTSTMKYYYSTPHVTESIEFGVKNFPPTIQNRLKRLAVISGKYFSYFIPDNTFSDTEDANNLMLEFLDVEGLPVKKESWCQFNPRTKEIYGLPLEDDISEWAYIVKATDQEGASVSDRLEIVVQQYKAHRAINHEFSLQLVIEKKHAFPYRIDWPVRVLHGLASLYHVRNLSEIIVRNVNYVNDPLVFTWSNESLPTHFCPKGDIEKLFAILTSNDEGDPSMALIRNMIPELHVKKVSKHGLGNCEVSQQPPHIPATLPTNYAPILRNPIDHINATVGELLVFRVPDDTFYDPEDTDPRNLKLTLLTGDSEFLPVEHWLQFDVKNKEFYGIPLLKYVGRTEYQLVCEDSGGRKATDGLIVEVHPSSRINYNVEFSMILEISYESFVTSATMQRKFLEKLRELFNDRDTGFIQLSSIDRGSTIINWFNKSLINDVCPHEDIIRLKSVLINSDRTVASRVHDVMDPDFPVSAIRVITRGNCEVKPKIIPTPDIAQIDETAPQSSSDEYMITFIVPAIVIGAMLILAGIAACVLYRRRRSGKMNVEEDGRQSYGNKGIPVIFQEELEEKPEPGTKAPVILKDEKPPLAPPEYSKSGSLKLNDESEPYQPPPPFTRTQDSGRQSRPKPTPTYRKPPPYVPP